MTDPSRIGGILPVLYSYFDAGGGLRPGAFAAQTRHAVESGASGVVLFGFVTQFYRLSFDEKLAALHETAEALAGKGLLGVTVMEATVEGQVALVRAAEESGADFLVLQPPLAPPGCNPEWRSVIRAVAAQTDLPVTIQNATVAGATLSADELVALQAEAPNLVGVKAETTSVEIAALPATMATGSGCSPATGGWNTRSLPPTGRTD